MVAVQTSISCYKNLDADMIGECYREYISALWKLGRPSTDLEVTWAGGYTDPNKIRPRRFELEHNYGVVMECTSRVCNISGKQAKTFWFTGRGLGLL
jgi:hypothetical protein